MFRIFFATDLHGSQVCFHKFLSAANMYKAEALILGGDLTGKAIIPIYKTDDEHMTAKLLGKEYTANSRQEAESLNKLIKDLGYYGFETTREKWTEISATKSTMDELFLKCAAERMSEWTAIAKEKLRDAGPKVYATGGNDDPPEIDKIIESSEFLVGCHDKLVEIGGHEMISTGYSNMTPWKLPRDISEEELERLIEDLAARVKDMKNAIFNFHCPPYASKLDEAPKLTKDLKAKPEFIPVGSTAVRKAIEKYQPLLGLHGHIHESRGVIKIGETTCVNPGSEYGEGVLRGAVINLEPKKIKGYILTSG